MPDRRGEVAQIKYVEVEMHCYMRRTDAMQPVAYPHVVAASLSLLTSITAVVLQSRLIAGVNEGALQYQDIDTSMRVIGISSSILHAVCMALFLTAIFVGRKPRAGAGAA